jgi:hypothetical protein
MLQRGNPYGMHSHAGAWKPDKKLTKKSSVVHVEFTTECVRFLGLIINFGERKVRDFDDDLQDEF